MNTEIHENYYRVQFANWNDTVVYQYANNATEAIEQAKRQNPTIRGNAAVRKVALKEWSRNLTISGQVI